MIESYFAVFLADVFFVAADGFPAVDDFAADFLTVFFSTTDSTASASGSGLEAGAFETGSTAIDIVSGSAVPGR